LGGIAVLLKDDIFFKLKPALINLIFSALLGYSAYGKHNLLLSYSKRFAGDISLTAEAETKMQHMVKLLFWIMLAYTGLIIYSAFMMSKEAWAFISGGLLYVIFAIFFLIQFLTNKRKSTQSPTDEWLPLVDETGKITGKATRTAVHTNPKLMHPVIHVHIYNSQGEIYLQKRAATKDTQPGKWDTAVGGHINLNETVEQALARETLEELNINNLQPKALFRYVWKSDIETELVFSFTALYNAQPQVNRLEIDEGRFWNLRDIEKLLAKGIFTPNFEHEYKAVADEINKTLRLKPFISKL
jgi:isopentenyldiphosphate isomerase